MKATLLIFRAPHAALPARNRHARRRLRLPACWGHGTMPHLHLAAMALCCGHCAHRRGIGLGKTRLAPFLFGAALVTFLGGAGLSAWHAGIEYGFWAGPASCGTETNLGNLSGEALLDALEAKPMVRCDVPQWTLVGVSLAGWSLLAQVAICVLLVPTLRESS